MNDNITKVAEQIASIRIGAGLTLDEASYGAGIDEERLAAAEAGELALSEDELQSLADSYGVAVTAFFGGRITPKEYLFGA
jgi:transcriptional regulator with XRE-family HTH domain